MVSLEDRQIIDLFYARSEQAIAELDQKYGPAVRKTAFRILGSRQDAEECANDTYLGVWNTVPPPAPALSPSSRRPPACSTASQTQPTIISKPKKAQCTLTYSTQDVLEKSFAALIDSVDVLFLLQSQLQ